MTRTFENKEELMIALIQGEKWEHNEVVCSYDKSRKISDSFRVASSRVTEPISSFWKLCDGKTVWTRVKTELDLMKEKYKSGDYICISYVSDKWEINNYPVFIEIGSYKLIHKKHKDILDAYLADNSVEIEFSHHKDAIRFDVPDFIDSYSENCFYYLKPKKKTVFLAMFTCLEDKRWVDAKMYETLVDFKADYCSTTCTNHHEIPNTRYEIEIDDE